MLFLILYFMDFYTEHFLVSTNIENPMDLRILHKATKRRIQLSQKNF